MVNNGIVAWLATMECKHMTLHLEGDMLTIWIKVQTVSPVASGSPQEGHWRI